LNSAVKAGATRLGTLIRYAFLSGLVKQTLKPWPSAKVALHRQAGNKVVPVGSGLVTLRDGTGGRAVTFCD